LAIGLGIRIGVGSGGKREESGTGTY